MLSDKLLSEQLERLDYYAILGAARDATADAIREAFHRFALRFHPDQHVGDEASQERAARIFKRGSEGYRVLLDPAMRARYDAGLARGEVRLTQETARRSVVSEAQIKAVAEEPLPGDIKPLFEQAQAAFTKGDLKNARAFLMLVARKSSHPKIQQLTREILEAERAMLRRR